MSSEETYTSGAVAPESGVYEVRHYRHRLRHEVTLLRGERFPECGECGSLVRYRGLLTASHITADNDFRSTPRVTREAEYEDLVQRLRVA
jgi:hypothetical protein